MSVEHQESPLSTKETEEQSQSMNFSSSKRRALYATLISLPFVALGINYAVRHSTALSPSNPSSSNLRRNLELYQSEDELHTPSVSWLLTFPNSGTMFVTDLVSALSKKATGTIYGNEVGQYLPVGNLDVFRYRPDQTIPDKFILTKTHCGGWCFECKPRHYHQTPEAYLNECSTGMRRSFADDGSVLKDTKTKLNAFDVVKSAVHVFRDPMDNVVARFHYMYKRHKKLNDDTWVHSYNRDGFRSWCEEEDVRFLDQEPEFFDSDVLRAAEDVPCHAEFFKYIQWHNNAFVMTDEMLVVPTHVMKYEDFGVDYRQASERLLGFLELPIVGRATEFQHHGYGEYYSGEELRAIAVYVKMISSEKTWEHVRGYFPAELVQEVERRS